MFRRKVLVAEHRWTCLAYFAALGLGFIVIEIALLQRFLMFLGQPIYTYAVVLASLLISTGIGSHVSATRSRDPAGTPRRFLPLALLVVVGTPLITPFVFASALGLSVSTRIAISIALVSPLGCALGVPLPLGLRLASRQSASLAAWAWGVNGFFTVIGTVLTLMLGMMIGFRLMVLVACTCYGFALLAVSRLHSVRSQPMPALHAAQTSVN